MSATADISLAQQWLSNCAASHPDCRNPSSTRLPYRILDLSFPGALPDLRLCVGVKSPGCYAALSHCWGASQPLKLTKETLDAFQDRVAYNKLPRTFQDAVAVTRSLGLRYLWIDSLCIMQDSKQDWEEQCAEMGRIYKDSYVTLAGTASSGCHDGFLHPRPQSHDVTMQLSDNKGQCQVVLSHHGIVASWIHNRPEPDSPLLKRAWVLQERLLSERTLYFGTDKMYLECLTNVQVDNSHNPDRWRFANNGIITKYALDQLESRADPFRQWDDIVTGYSALHLTKATDRLPALSGLASHMQSATGGRYLAGLWHEDVLRGLGWFVVPRGRDSPVFRSTSAYIAPSWSWAATPFGVTRSGFSCQDPFHGDADIIAAGTTPAGADPFGAVKDGFIDVSGRVQRGLVEERPDANIPGRRTLYLLSGDAEDSPAIGTYTPDNSGMVEERRFGVLLLYLGTDSPGHGAAIAIEAVEDEMGTYRRVGLAMTNGMGPWEVFKGVEKTRIRLV